MSHVFEFDSFEEAQAMMATAEAKANAAVTAKQQEIAYGTYWLRPVEGQLFFEYGYVLTQGEAETGQTRETIRALRDAYARGYRFSRACSLYTPSGELGDSHIAVLWPITEAEFHAANNHNWELCMEPWEVAMLQRIQLELAESKRNQEAKQALAERLTSDPSNPTSQEDSS